MSEKQQLYRGRGKGLRG